MSKTTISPMTPDSPSPDDNPYAAPRTPPEAMGQRPGHERSQLELMALGIVSIVVGVVTFTVTCTGIGIASFVLLRPSGAGSVLFVMGGLSSLILGIWVAFKVYEWATS